MIDNLGKSGGLGGERKTEYKIQETKERRRNGGTR